MRKSILRSAAYEYAKTSAYASPNKHWHASNKAEAGLGAGALIGLLIPLILVAILIGIAS